MEITNINIFSILIFLSSIGIIWYFIFLKYKENNINNYKNIKFIFLLLSFLILLPWIFVIKKELYIDNKTTKWLDIVFVLDVSKSMQVWDIESENNYYTRLDFAKKSIADYVIKKTNNLYSLVIFSWDAVSTTPLTNDINFFLTSLNNVDYKNLTIQWTNFQKAIIEANNRFEIEENQNKVIILFSDWWDIEDEIKRDFLTNYKKENIYYYIVWVWTKNWGKIITWRDAFGRLKYQTFNQEEIISRLNEDNLKNIANYLNWEYTKLEKYNDLTSFLNNIEKLEKKVIELNAHKSSNDISRMLGIISFVLFIIYLLVYLFEDNLFKNKKNET